ncbi:DHA2 family efflux MFS transporter permease subunit [Micromonospora sp. NPDC023956]|uniref:DHA2 family efflux MFS transporter permease subunit n=1 Tax=Micromonospora sp. NPDC023956 TaxID=3155722 RepID=UPI0033F00B9C
MTTRLRGNPWAILAVLCLAYFMSQLDIAVLAIAVPDIVRDLDASLDQVVWALSSYLLALAALLITAGRLGDLYGRRRLFLIGVGIFTVFSLAGGLADSPAQLVAARAIQGVGAALFVPQTMALLVEAFPPERRGMALGIRGGVGGSAAVLGPVVGGFLVGSLDWRWVFLVNIPIGVVMLALAAVTIPTTGGRKEHRLDVVGVVLATVFLLLLAFGVSQGARYSWSGGIWAVIAAGLVVFAVFLAQQRRRQHREPLVPFALFRDRNFAVMNVFSVVVSLTVIGLIVVLSVTFQSVLQFGAWRAGLLLMVASIFSVAFDPVAGKLSERVEGRHLLLFGMAATVAGLLWTFTQIRAEAGWAGLVGPMVVIGTGNAFLFTPLATVALHRVRPESAGGAAGVLVTSMQVGSMVGTAVTGALLQGGSGTVPTVGTVRDVLLLLVGTAALGALVCLAVERSAGPDAAAPAEVSPAQMSDDRA